MKKIMAWRPVLALVGLLCAAGCSTTGAAAAAQAAASAVADNVVVCTDTTCGGPGYPACTQLVANSLICLAGVAVAGADVQGCLSGLLRTADAIRSDVICVVAASAGLLGDDSLLRTRVLRSGRPAPVPTSKESNEALVWLDSLGVAVRR